MTKFFGAGGLRIEPEVMSTMESDYWEEFTRVNDAFVHEPDVIIRKAKKVSTVQTDKINGQLKSSDGGTEMHELTTTRSSKVYPYLSAQNGMKGPGFENNFVGDEYTEFRSVAVQTDGNYDEELELPYKCCFCCRSTTPCVVWIFVGISIVFFKMGAIVTGRWIYLSSSTFDEIVFYIAFTVCLGFATIYFRRGIKYHNPFDLIFLMLTIPIMWALLTFTTTFLKKDIFFYVGSGVYSIFIVPYTLMGFYMTYRFWKQGKFFLRRVEGNSLLEPYCRKLFFTQSLIMYDTQLTVLSSIVSMAPAINQDNTAVWISSLVMAPISICCAILTLIVGYIAIRKENRKLTWIFTILNTNPFLLVITMLLKRPMTPGIYYVFINVTILALSITLLTCHIGMLSIVWNWIVPAYGKGLKGPVNRTSRNNCIQCARLTICR